VGTPSEDAASCAAGRADLVDVLTATLGSRREARWIVEHVEGVGLTGDDRAAAARALADRRREGEPLQYVLGRWPFRSLELRVDSRALIPRPETEQVVEMALAELAAGADAAAAERGAASERGSGPVAVDLGTGTGAIALSLAREGGGAHRGLEVWACDASTDALVLAGQNLDDLASADAAAAARVRLVRGDWFAALPDRLAGRIDLVVSNPPYVAEEEYAGLDPVVRHWEPRLALVAGSGSGGAGGMAAIEAIVAEAPRWLNDSGRLVVEIAPSQATAAQVAARRAGFDQVTTAEDLVGRVRMLVARR
jgi:release factor glutamine methyltransferase